MFSDSMTTERCAPPAVGEEVPSKAHPTMHRKGDGEARNSYDHFEGQYRMELAESGPGWIRTTTDWTPKSA